MPTRSCSIHCSAASVIPSLNLHMVNIVLVKVVHCYITCHCMLFIPASVFIALVVIASPLTN